MAVAQVGSELKGIIFFIVIHHQNCGLIVLSGLDFAAIAFLPEGEVQIVAVEADPISFPTLGGSFGDSRIGEADIFDGGEVGFHC